MDHGGIGVFEIHDVACDKNEIVNDGGRSDQTVDIATRPDCRGSNSVGARQSFDQTFE